jgi:hypothetical protein
MRSHYKEILQTVQEKMKKLGEMLNELEAQNQAQSKVIQTQQAQLQEKDAQILLLTKQLENR